MTNLEKFTDRNDVERIYTKLNNKKHFVPVHILSYTTDSSNDIQNDVRKFVNLINMKK